MSERQKRNVIIISLCGVLLLMTIGYAAFNTLLNINGTASITSNWDIKITSIKQNAKEGDASSVEEFPKYEDLEATFNVNLVSPGDYITYDVTIENKGTIDAELNKIILPQLNNEAVLITTSGLAAGDELLVDHSATLTVKIEYNPEITKQPENKTASFEMKLDYVQKNKAEVEPSTVIDMKGIEVPIVTTGDGLYADTYENGRYIYKGASPNNYITFNGEAAGWRIMAIETDGTIKIMRYDEIVLTDFDQANARVTGYCSFAYNNGTHYGCNVWAKTDNFDNNSTKPNGVSGKVDNDSYTKTYLNTTYYEQINEQDRNNIQKHNFYYGAVDSSETNLANQIKSEQAYSAKSYIGMVTASDYIRSNNNPTTCNSLATTWGSTVCGATTYMAKNVYWPLMTPSYLSNLQTYQNACMIYDVKSTGGLGAPNAVLPKNIRPVLFLKSNISLQGQGTKEQPYIVAE